jgi:hypothetical protein
MIAHFERTGRAARHLSALRVWVPLWVGCGREGPSVFVPVRKSRGAMVGLLLAIARLEGRQDFECFVHLLRRIGWPQIPTDPGGDDRYVVFAATLVRQVD